MVPCPIVPHAAAAAAAVRFVSDNHLVLPTTQPSSAGAEKLDGKGAGSQAGLHVPRGSILCICPIESHHDPALYPDEPWTFKPER